MTHRFARTSWWWSTMRLLGASMLIGAFTQAAGAQEPAGFGTCIPVAQRGTRDVGCFIITDQHVGRLGPAPVYWHIAKLDSTSLASLREHNRAGNTVVHALDQDWLMTVGDSTRSPAAGRQVAVIGPLPVDYRRTYSALYMEATMHPGMKSAIHRHSGIEAWYTLTGETCLETSQTVVVGRAGGPPVIIPAGVPMELTATGTTTRASLVLILHDASQPPTTMERSWKPRGLCK